MEWRTKSPKTEQKEAVPTLREARTKAVKVRPLTSKKVNYVTLLHLLLLQLSPAPSTPSWGPMSDPHHFL